MYVQVFTITEKKITEKKLGILLTETVIFDLQDVIFFNKDKNNNAFTAQ